MSRPSLLNDHDPKPPFEIITYKQWASCARKVERQRLRATGTSLTASSLMANARDAILEVMGETHMKVRVGWRDWMAHS